MVQNRHVSDLSLARHGSSAASDGCSAGMHPAPASYTMRIVESPVGSTAVHSIRPGSEVRLEAWLLGAFWPFLHEQVGVRLRFSVQPGRAPIFLFPTAERSHAPRDQHNSNAV